MREDLRNILDNLPPKPPRSRLEPYSAFIHEMLQRGWTYREIASVLGEKCAVPVAPSTVHHFVRVRGRAKKRRKGALPVSAAPSRITTAKTATFKATVVQGEHNEGTRALRKRIAALKGRQAPAEVSGTTFRYNPNEPLRLKQGHGKAKGVD
jgi:IS30 family transposase